MTWIAHIEFIENAFKIVIIGFHIVIVIDNSIFISFLISLCIFKKKNHELTKNETKRKSVQLS